LAVFLVDLSGFKTAVDARRGEEISGDVLDGTAEEIFEVAMQMQYFWKRA
jgi:hypothetical protein